MSNYTKTTNFATKDSLPSGNAAKIVSAVSVPDTFNVTAVVVPVSAALAESAFVALAICMLLNSVSISVPLTILAALPEGRLI